MLIGFPMPIILALLINEIKNLKFRKVIQNITYMPNFLSVVIIVSMLTLFSNADYGLFNKITGVFGMPSVDFMSKPSFFQPLYVFSNVWQFMGFNAIIYIAALAGVDMEQHEAAIIDGCTPFQLFTRVIIHLLKPALVTIFVLNFMGVWNDFTMPLYYLNNSRKWPMTLAVYNFFGMYERQYNLVCADIVLTMCPVLLIFILGQKYIVGGISTGAVKG